MHYHCPVFGVFNFLKPKTKSIDRTIWKYELGNYNELRNSFANFDWDSTNDNNINIYAENLADTISENSLKFIPKKKIIVNPQEPTWMNRTIKKEIRRRKRLYRKAKQSNNASHWTKFKSVRNKVISLIRHSKGSYFERSSMKLKSDNLSPRDWWKTLKSMISPHTAISIPPLFDVSNDSSIVDDHEKANIYIERLFCKSVIYR